MDGEARGHCESLHLHTIGRRAVVLRQPAVASALLSRKLARLAVLQQSGGCAVDGGAADGRRTAAVAMAVAAPRMRNFIDKSHEHEDEEEGMRGNGTRAHGKPWKRGVRRRAEGRKRAI